VEADQRAALLDPIIGIASAAPRPLLTLVSPGAGDSRDHSEDTRHERPHEPIGRTDSRIVVMNGAQAPYSAVPEPAPVEGDDDAMRAQVKRLARPHRSGGWVIERASLLAGGPEFGAAMTWIEAHGGVPELAAAPRVQRGLHSARGAESVAPLRFVLPADALS
jgi:hypothetical protein